MGRYQLTRDITASPDRVFEAFTDPVMFADWMHLSRVTEIQGEFGSVGCTFVMVVGGPWRLRSKVIASRPGSFHEWAGRGPFGASYHISATLTETNGTTHVAMVTDYVVPFGRLGRWIDRRWIDRPERTTANREFDRLVELVTAGPARATTSFDGASVVSAAAEARR